ncbi:neurotrimin-like [Saccoglossus kowalevskii]|uniref:Neurotrimin-like n=1 Tax=Saccoglossus kowalevskii TaxID=10224 RepID=A0ABM0M0N6_SACKO|nr:PREDICTED: neurotrimin-like [Saccoglossus kowalevskii]
MHTVLLAISLLVVSVIGQRVEPFDKNITISNGNDVDLECVISGVADNQFLSWTRITETDGGSVTTDVIAFDEQLAYDGSDPDVPNSPARYSLIKTSTRYTLEIDDAKMEDEGKFECSISKTDQKQAVWLTVKTVPEIDPITGNFFAHENKTYELKCIASGSPKPSIVWSRPGDMLPSGEYLSHGSILELVNMSSSHRGVYQCAASNTEGSVKRTVEITMDHKPEVTVVKEVVLAWPGETASLTCLFEANPSASLTQWIKVDSGRTIK